MGMTNFVIVGAGGLSGFLCDIIEEIHGNDAVIGYIDEDTEKKGRDYYGKPVLGGLEWFKEREPKEYHAAISPLRPASRKRISLKLLELDLNFPNIIHPSAWISKSVKIGIGNIFAHNSVVAAETAIGNFNFFHAGGYIGHNISIEDYCFFGPGAKITEQSTVREGASIGAGAAVIRKSTIGKWSVVGANGVVTKDVRENATAHGVPAREISSIPK